MLYNSYFNKSIPLNVLIQIKIHPLSTDGAIVILVIALGLVAICMTYGCKCATLLSSIFVRRVVRVQPYVIEIAQFILILPNQPYKL